MASSNPENEEDGSGLDLIGKAKGTAMNSCDSIKNSLGIWHILGLCVSPLIHAVDIGSDVNLAYRYYEDGELLYCGLTGFFIAGPTILVSILQKMYFQDFSPGSILKWLYQMVMMILPISPFLSSFQALNHVRFLKKTVTEFAENPDLDKFDAFQKRYDTLQQEKSTSAMLSVAEGFLKSAPQLVLQITIVLSRAQLTGSSHLYLSVGSSFAATMKAFVGFYNSVQKDKPTRIGTMLLYVWSALVITSRVMAMSLGVSIHPIETSTICIIHWLGMTVWLAFLENTRYCTPPKPGKLRQLLGQIPVETLTKVGSQVKNEALAKVGALASVFTRNEVEAPEKDVEATANDEVNGGQVGGGEVQANGETQADGEKTQTDAEAQKEEQPVKTDNGVTLKKIFFSAIFGLIYIFVYVSIIEKPTRNKYAFYYFVWFLENCFFLVIGCRELFDNEAWLVLGLRAVTLGAVVLSLVIMFIYIMFYNVSLWPKKGSVSGTGFGLETAYQYGLNGLKAIDPTQLIPLKSINPAQFIPTLESLPTAIPGAELISGLIPGKENGLPDSVPGAQLISGLVSGKEASLPNAIPGAQLISGLFAGKEDGSSDTKAGAQLTRLFSRDEGVCSPADAIPGAQLVSGLLSGKEESSPTQVVSGLLSGGGENPTSATNFISGLISKKDDESTSPTVESVTGLVSGTKGDLSSAIPGVELVSGLVPSKDDDSSDDSGLGAQSIVGLMSGKEESISNVVPGAELVSGLVSGKDESSAGATTATQFISGLIPGKEGGSFKVWGK